MGLILNHSGLDYSEAGGFDCLFCFLRQSRTAFNGSMLDLQALKPVFTF